MAIANMTILDETLFVGVLMWIFFFEAGELRKLEMEVHTT